MSGRAGEIITDIVEDGLVFNMDAANRVSYPKTGDTWFDTIGTNQASFHGPQFDTLYNKDSIYFDGSDDYLITGNAGISNLTQLTMECWVRINSFTSYTGIFTLFSANGGYKGYGFNSNVSNRIKFIVAHNNDGTFTYINSNSNFTAYTWYHLVGVVDSTEAYFYINGVRQTDEASYTTPSVPGNIPITFGRFYYHNNSFYGFNGRIANSRIYNRVLSANEVLHNYNGLRGRFGL